MDLSKLKREEAIPALQALKESLGWKMVKEILEQNIKFTQKVLNGEMGEKIKDISQLETLQNELNFQKKMIKLPDKLFKDYETTGGIVPDDDPYDKD